jgi:uncharacterized protein (TIGR00730 family)
MDGTGQRPTRPEPRAIDDSLLTRQSWKVFQIMAEFVEGFEHLATSRPSVSISGSVRTPVDTPDCALAEAIARQLSDAGFPVVSSCSPGIMEAANKGAYAGRSLSIGLNIDLPHGRSGNPFRDIALHFRHFCGRKVMLVKYASADVVPPSGFGALGELAEILTLIQTGKIRRIPVVLVKARFWHGLVESFRHALVATGTISESDLGPFVMVDKPEEVVDANFSRARGVWLRAVAESAQVALGPSRQEAL